METTKIPEGLALAVSDETRAKFREQLEEMTGSAENQAALGTLGDAVAKRDESLRQELLGADLGFDPKDFITKGVIAKKNIPIRDGIWADMHSLTTKERMLAEALVREHFGNMRLDNVYMTAIEAAIVAVSVTRINGATFENPDITKSTSEKDSDNKRLYESKMELFKMMLDASNELVSMITVVYRNLEAVSVPSEEVQKKS